ncbi:hypothetical protein Tsubulata_027927 [Turnera subulata]|uniref:DUF4283 domain-containing protein n=1 Tax=Turnera subulata TaxID=218843 RepID=A0A9Q0FGD2_9ROSI|nr:hypothetical protein Tsubulata_027927 [Turnera subulata]
MLHRSTTTHECIGGGSTKHRRREEQGLRIEEEISGWFFWRRREEEDGQRRCGLRRGEVSEFINGIKCVRSDTWYLHANVARVRAGKSVVRQTSGSLLITFKSYAATVAQPPQITGPLPRPPVPTPATLTYTPLEDTMEWLSRSAFGVLRNPTECSGLLKAFLEKGVGGVSFSPVGVDTVLASFTTATAMKAFCESKFDWVQQRFIFFRPCEQGDGASDRTYWLRVSSIPLHTWSDDFLHHVALHVGKLIEIAPETKNRIKLDAAWIRVHISIREQVH